MTKRFAVFKYSIPFIGLGQLVQITMSKEAEILRVGVQQENPVLWCRTDPYANDIVNRTFAVLATGQVVDHYTDGDYVYRGTFEVRTTLVFHVFELI